MALSSERKTDLTFKKAVNKDFTDHTKAWYEEVDGGGFNLTSAYVWNQDIPASPPGSSTSIVKCYVDGADGNLTLTEDVSVANQRSWKAEVGGTRVADWIPSKYAQAYTVKIYEDNGGGGKGAQIFTTDASDWFFDYERGILTFQDLHSFTSPIHLEAYAYIGTKGDVGGTFWHTALSGRYGQADELGEHPQFAPSGEYIELSGNYITHRDDTTNPHEATFNQVRDQQGGSDVTLAELEELTDGSQTTLHAHAGGGGDGTFWHPDLSGTFGAGTLGLGEHPQFASSGEYVGLSGNLITHRDATNNPHAATFTQVRAQEGGADVTLVELEELSDGSYTELHSHPQHAPSGEYVGLSGDYKTHRDDTSNPHESTFALVRDEEGGSDVSLAELETLTDGSDSDSLHTHPLHAPLAQYTGLSGDYTTHRDDTSNPHEVTFAQARAQEGGSDVTLVELEELTDGSLTSLHIHPGGGDGTFWHPDLSGTFGEADELAEHPQFAPSGQYVDLSGAFITHQNNTSNPHSVSFSQGRTEEGGSDVTLVELETLSDGSDADALHFHPQYASSGEYIGTSGDFTTHRDNTSNPHEVTFAQGVTQEGGSDVSLNELETLSDGSDADSLHTHPIYAPLDLYTGLSGNYTTHRDDTSNPHDTTFSQVRTQEGGSDVTLTELEQLSDGSDSDSLHFHPQYALSGQYVGLSGAFTTHRDDTANPHEVTFSQSRTQEGGSDVTLVELEELTDGSQTALHTHAGGGGGGTFWHPDLSGTFGEANELAEHPQFASSGEYVGLSGAFTTHRDDTTNPHEATFTQTRTQEGGSDVTLTELETLSDGSDADALHIHGVYVGLSGNYITHRDNTSNPHEVTFSQSRTQEGGSDVSLSELEQLTDGSDSDSLHKHTQYAISGEYVGLSGAFTAHVGDTNNPHDATFAQVRDQGGGSDATLAELEELTDGSETTLHSHAGGPGGGGTFWHPDLSGTYGAGSAGLGEHPQFAPSGEYIGLSGNFVTHRDDTSNPHTVTLDLACDAGNTTNQDIKVGGDLYVNYDGGEVDSVMYFYEGGSETGASIKWNTTDTRFEFSNDVHITGDLIVTGVISEGGTAVKKTLDWTGAVTGSTVWDPTGGTKFVITQILLNATADCTVTLFDNTDSTTNRIFKADMADMQSIVIPFRKPVESSTADNILKITTSAAGGRVTIVGYEI